MHKILIFVAFCITPAIVLAHGDSPSLEAEVRGYLVDIGVSQEGIRPGEEVTFDFDLFTTDERPQFVHFGTVNVTITKDAHTVMSQSVLNESMYVPTLSYTFLSEGAYQLTAAYMTGSSLIVSHSFDLAVSPTSGTAARIENRAHYVIALILVVFTAIYIVVSFLRRKA